MTTPNLTQIDDLLDHLKSDNPQHRQAAAIELARVQDARVIPHLRQALNDDDSTVRANAALGLGINNATDAIDALINCLQDDEDIVRERAATALAQIGTGRAIEPMIDALDTSGTWARNRMIYVLGASKDVRVVEPLIVQLNHPDATTQGVAAWALGALGDPRALEPLRELLHDSNASVRGNAAWGLGELLDQESIPELLALLNDDSAEVRGKTAWALGTLGEETGDTRMIDPLIALLDDYAEIPNDSAHVFVCQYAAEALTQIGTPEALQAVEAWKPQAREKLLPRRIQDMIRALQHQDLQTRERAIDELKSIGNAAVPDLIAALTSHDHARVRQGVAQALGELGAINAVHALTTGLADPDIGVWSQAVAALAKIGHGKPLRSLLSSKKQRVKQGAAIALWRIQREEKAFKVLLQCVQDDELVVRGSAITSLWMQPDERAVATLQIQLQKEEGMMAKYILQALQTIGGSTATATVANWIKDNGLQ